MSVTPAYQMDKKELANITASSSSISSPALRNEAEVIVGKDYITVLLGRRTVLQRDNVGGSPRLEAHIYLNLSSIVSMSEPMDELQRVAVFSSIIS
jgi:hypothetical protein